MKWHPLLVMIKKNMKDNLEKYGIVVIGRNEGIRLAECFKSIKNNDCRIIYVDSASTDNSLEIAKQFKIETISLDPYSPLNAARGRNAGAQRLLELDPSIPLIQFIDGDTALDKNWLQTAQTTLQKKTEIAVLVGDLTEKNPSSSIYKQLSALEWEQVYGEVKSVGGNCMIRTQVFLDVGGFNSEIAAAEDSELCYRIRQKGWKIFHMNVPMGIHDTQIFNFRHFCKRCVRTGYAYQQVSMLYKNNEEKIFLRENLSNWIYGGVIPVLAIGLMPLSHGLSLLLFLIYPFLFGRIFFRMKKCWNPLLAFLYAFMCVITKFPGFYGACKYLLKRKN
jgi:glycosyltransferase involved in cell wall biosynthesis